MFKKSLLAATLIVLAAGCAAEEGTTSDRVINDRDTLTRRQKDSITATLPLPGAGVVGRALEVQDAMGARAAGIDSVTSGNR